MAAALADRLAEAFAEYLHREVRINLWGYSKNEELSPEDMLKVKCHAKTGIILVVVIPLILAYGRSREVIIFSEC